MERTLARDVREVVKYVVSRARNADAINYHGITVPVGATSELGSLRRKLLRGQHEASAITAVEALLKVTDTVVEVGAGTGVLTAIMAKRARMVVSFEANPRLARSAEAVFLASGVGVDYRTAAIGSKAGMGQFFLDRRSMSGGGASLIDRGHGDEITVEVLPFGDVLREVMPSFVMMDAEGAEIDLLAEPLPAHVRVLCAEVHPHVIGDEAVTTIVRDLIGQGFTLLLDQSGVRVLAFGR